jgi:hypothetical protein
MATIRDQTFADQRMVIDDGTEFVNCRFESCNVIVTAQEPVRVGVLHGNTVADVAASSLSLYPCR